MSMQILIRAFSMQRTNSMLSFRRVSSTLVTTAVMAIFMTSSLVHAQSGTPAVACDTTFGTDAGSVFANVNKETRFDTKNTAYSDFVQNTWKPRFDAFRTSLTATAAADSGMSSASASAVCADTAYQAQIPADLKTLPSPDSTSAASIGSTLL